MQELGPYEYWQSSVNWICYSASLFISFDFLLLSIGPRTLFCLNWYVCKRLWCNRLIYLVSYYNLQYERWCIIIYWIFRSMCVKCTISWWIVFRSFSEVSIVEIILVLFLDRTDWSRFLCPIIIVFLSEFGEERDRVGFCVPETAILVEQNVLSLLSIYKIIYNCKDCLTSLWTATLPQRGSGSILIITVRYQELIEFSQRNTQTHINTGTSKQYLMWTCSAAALYRVTST